jgi:hypothetical protein
VAPSGVPGYSFAGWILGLCPARHPRVPVNDKRTAMTERPATAARFYNNPRPDALGSPLGAPDRPLRGMLLAGDLRGIDGDHGQAMSLRKANDFRLVDDDGLAGFDCQDLSTRFDQCAQSA